jgi:hypothetical protein
MTSITEIIQYLREKSQFLDVTQYQSHCICSIGSWMLAASVTNPSDVTIPEGFFNEILEPDFTEWAKSRKVR